MKYTFRGEVKQDGLHIYHRAEFEKTVQEFVGKKVSITVEKAKRKRSNAQNAAYWGYVLPMVKDGLNELGWAVSLEWTHDYLKKEFLKGEQVNEKTGEIKTFTKSTTELSTSEFMDFIAEVQRWGAEDLNIYIPDPGEQTEISI